MSIETRVRPIDWWQIWRPRVNFGLLFPEAKFSTTDMSHSFCRNATKFCSVMGLDNRNLFPEFRELWSVGPMIPCGDMHQSFTDTLVKWFFNNFLMFADSFSVLSIQCVARRLGANFMCKCHASRGGSLRQHGFLVFLLAWHHYCQVLSRAYTAAVGLVKPWPSGLLQWPTLGLSFGSADGVRLPRPVWTLRPVQALHT